jgi:3-ketosteroid 9alpha-monooxygenase subunit B
VIFRDELDKLASEYPERLEIFYRYDDRDGFIALADVRKFASDRSSAEFFVCGPAAFMSTIERGLLEEGVAEQRIHIERFISPPDPDERSEAGEPAIATDNLPTRITVNLDGESHVVPYVAGQTILVACQTAGLRPPFSCTEAFCGCCMAKLVSGNVQMRNNDFLSKKEVAQGWVLTCQAVPLTTDVEVRYPD